MHLKEIKDGAEFDRTGRATQELIRLIQINQMLKAVLNGVF